MLPGVKLAILIIDLHACFHFHGNHGVGAGVGRRAIGVIVLHNLGLIAGYVEDLPILFSLSFDSVSNVLNVLQACKGAAALVAVIDGISRVGGDF